MAACRRCADAAASDTDALRRLLLRADRGIATANLAVPALADVPAPPLAVRDGNDADRRSVGTRILHDGVPGADGAAGTAACAEESKEGAGDGTSDGGKKGALPGGTVPPPVAGAATAAATARAGGGAAAGAAAAPEPPASSAARARAAKTAADSALT